MSKELREFHEDVWHCSKCFCCAFINPYYLTDENYYYGCPAGKYFEFDSHHASGRMELARGIIEEEIPYPTEKMLEIIYSCTTCGLCNANCSFLKGLEPVEVIEAVRRKLVEDGIAPLPKHKKFAESTEKNHNPYGEAHKKRTRELKDAKINPNAESIYFIGCTSSYRTKDIASATIEILNKLDIDYTIMGDEEWCCGSPLFRTGQMKIAKEVMEHNINTIKENFPNAKRILFSCAGCYRTFITDYKKFELDFDIKLVHMCEFLQDLINDGKIELPKKDELITYHDPCHLGRHCDVYEPPREVIKSIANLIEMPRNRINAWCCGSGGGVKSAYNEMAISTAKERIEEAKSTKAEFLMSTCPFCQLNLAQANKQSSEKIKVLDLVEYINKLI
ncbi:MAG: (Fe-S)-binding protein [Candidatus Lokiarchaeota archaeon]|nr:(Fe-S)-binding protein [Candidatus Lokiarchaeota archaeon]